MPGIVLVLLSAFGTILLLLGGALGDWSWTTLGLLYLAKALGLPAALYLARGARELHFY